MQIVDTPPPVNIGRKGFVEWPEVAARLRDLAKEDPVAWGQIDDVARSTAAQIRGGANRSFRPVSDWEVTQRKDETDPKRATLFIRYVGTAQ